MYVAARVIAIYRLSSYQTYPARAEHHEIVEAADLDLLFAGAEHAAHDGGDGAFGPLLAQLVGRHEPDEHLLGLNLAVADRGEEIVGLGDGEIHERLGEFVAVDDRLRAEIVPARFLLEQPASKLHRARLFLR